MRVCKCRVRSVGCGDPALSDWLSDVIGRRCRLVRQSRDNLRRAKRKSHSNGGGNDKGAMAQGPPLSLANESQYLMVAQGSLEQLLSQIKERDQDCELGTVQKLADRFRANLIVGGQEMAPYIEEGWTSIAVGGFQFEVSNHHQIVLTHTDHNWVESSSECTTFVTLMLF